MLVNYDNLRQVINKGNPRIDFTLFHAKCNKDYLRYFRWRVLKNLVRSETTPHKGSLKAWAFSSLNGGTYTGPGMIDASVSPELAMVRMRQFSSRVSLSRFWTKPGKGVKEW